MAGVFSVVYWGQGVVKAVDWNWPRYRQWTVSVNENGLSWEPSGLDLDAQAYRVLLIHFGLDTWAADYPPEKVVGLPPAELVAVRRQKEKEHNLSVLKVRNDALGAAADAEQFQ